MDKLDFKKTLDSYRARRGQFRIVDVPDLQYLMVDGHGDPNSSPAFGRAIESLYPIAYKLKFASKAEPGTRLRRAAPGGPVVGRGHGRVHDLPRQVAVELDADADGPRLDRS